MNGGKMELFCTCKSLGVVIETNVLMRVSGMKLLPESDSESPRQDNGLPRRRKALCTKKRS
jgi:hypothetical protein